MPSLSIETTGAERFQCVTRWPRVGAEKSTSPVHVATSHTKIASRTQEQTLALDQGRAMPLAKPDTLTDKLRVSMVAFVQDIVFLYRLLRHPKTPWYVRGLLVLPVMYICSPIQLIPSFIPVLGQMDDVFVIWITKRFAQRLVDEKTRRECHNAGPQRGFPFEAPRGCYETKAKPKPDAVVTRL